MCLVGGCPCLRFVSEQEEPKKSASMNMGELANRMIALAYESGFSPKETVYVMTGAAAAVTMKSSTATRDDFIQICSSRWDDMVVADKPDRSPLELVKDDDDDAKTH